MSFEEQKVRIEVVKSECKHYQQGDVIMIDGALIDKAASSNVCVTALSAIFPFVFALRKRVSPEALGFTGEVTAQCPDNCAPVVFKLIPFSE
ncbi:hypothetical protein JCM15765_35650 [Paradesulfitobacterium aromaticivorans]